MANVTPDPIAHGGNIRWAAKTFGIPDDKLLDFSANINRTPWPRRFEQVLSTSLCNRQDYPDPEYEALRETVAAQTGTCCSCVSVGNGSIELLYALFRSRPRLRMVLLEPTFGEYRRALEMTSGQAIVHRLTASSQWRLDRSTVNGLLQDADGIIVCTPNNPTGRLLDADSVQWLLSHAERGKLIVFDEAFMDYVEDVGAVSSSSRSAIIHAVSGENVFVLRSLTKFFGMAGLRLGLGFGGRKLTASVRRQQEPWTVNCVAEGLGRVLYSPDPSIEAWREDCRRAMMEEREQLRTSMLQLGLDVFPSDASFLLVDVRSWGMSAADLQYKLGRRGLLVRDCSSFFGENATYVRIAVRSSADNSRLIAALKEVCS